ncbi:MAG TPA: DUF429 domain-containing protein [Acidimicrobiales bacterium]|nr:DUF429 domain-containing protein [Acidimicrobiales bacterium]
MRRVVGVDGCRGGWVGVVLGGGAPPRAVFGPAIVALMDRVGEVAAVAVDMPLHLSDRPWPRPCDVETRRFLGARRHTLFVVPPRAAYAAATYAEACAVARAATGKAPSRQAWALGPKIAEVEAWHRARPGEVHEVHPETSFAVMAGGPLATRKATPEGVAERRAALAAAGIALPDGLGRRGTGAAEDDVLDAAAAAWSARRIAAGAARAFGAVAWPDGCVQAIWA